MNERTDDDSWLQWFLESEIVGYAYGNPIQHGDRYRQRTSPAPAEKYTAERPWP